MHSMIQLLGIYYLWQCVGQAGSTHPSADRRVEATTSAAVRAGSELRATRWPVYLANSQYLRQQPARIPHHAFFLKFSQTLLAFYLDWNFHGFIQLVFLFAHVFSQGRQGRPDRVIKQLARFSSTHAMLAIQRGCLLAPSYQEHRRSKSPCLLGCLLHTKKTR